MRPARTIRPVAVLAFPTAGTARHPARWGVTLLPEATCSTICVASTCTLTLVLYCDFPSGPGDSKSLACLTAFWALAAMSSCLLLSIVSSAVAHARTDRARSSPQRRSSSSDWSRGSIAILSPNGLPTQAATDKPAP